LTYTEVFDEAFPAYLAIGMTYDQFWYGEPDLVEYYRKAHQFQLEEQNFMAYMQGIYVRDAIAEFVEFYGFAKNPKPLNKYPKEPYPITHRGKAKSKEDKEEEIANYYLNMFKRHDAERERLEAEREIRGEEI
jgi:hypothetical protein